MPMSSKIKEMARKPAQSAGQDLRGRLQGLPGVSLGARCGVGDV